MIARLARENVLALGTLNDRAPRSVDRYPASAPAIAPTAAVRGKPGVRLELVVSHPQGAPHLPIVEIRKAA